MIAGTFVLQIIRLPPLLHHLLATRHPVQQRSLLSDLRIDPVLLILLSLVGLALGCRLLVLDGPGGRDWTISNVQVFVHKLSFVILRVYRSEHI